MPTTKTTLQTIWKDCQTRHHEDDGDKKYGEMLRYLKQIEEFFTHVLTNGMVELRTLGYYGKSEYTKEGLIEILSWKLGETFSYRLAVTPGSRKDYHQAWKKCWNAWIKKGGKFPFPEDRLPKRIKFVPTDCRAECPVTGDSFQWEFDGEALYPTMVRLNRKDSIKKRKVLEAEKAKLAKLANPTDEQKKRLAVLQKGLPEQGWADMELVNMDPVKPFKDVYGDTGGKYPIKHPEIDVPSGELVFANDLRDYVKMVTAREDGENPNTSAGRNKTALHAASKNLFYAFTGNSNPRVWQNKANPAFLRLGRPSEEPEREEEWSWEKASKEWNEIDRVSTQVWIITACDRTTLPPDFDLEEQDAFIVKVPPGRYQLIDYYDDNEMWENGVFIEIKPATKPKD